MVRPQRAARAPTRSGDTPVPAADVRRAPDPPLSLAWHTLPQGAVDYVNDTWSTFTGLSLAQSRGDGWQQALHPADRLRWRVAWAQAAHDGRPAVVRCRFACAAGGYRWFLSQVAPIRGLAGEVTGWLGTAAAPRPDPDAAQPRPVPRVLAGTEPFLVATVHDLRNELSVVRVTSQLMERYVRRPVPVEPNGMLSHLAQLQRSTAKMDALVEEFFDLARLQSDQPIAFNLQPTDLVALARRCVDEYAPTTEHPLRLSTVEADLVGHWDAARLERVLGNLLSNASKYSAPDSTISITITRDERGARAAAVLTVEDHGAGIPAQELPHIFTPFYRGSVTPQTPGTGIGLFGARAIVEQQGGTLALASTEGVGTSVTLRLPLLENPIRS